MTNMGLLSMARKKNFIGGSVQPSLEALLRAFKAKLKAGAKMELEAKK